MLNFRSFSPARSLSVSAGLGLRPVDPRVPGRGAEGMQKNASIYTTKNDHFILLKLITLPRQARDKHRESTQTSNVFSCSGRAMPLSPPFLARRNSAGWCEKRIVSSHLHSMLQTINLPRHARDRHRREQSRKRGGVLFSADSCDGILGKKTVF